MPCVPMQERFGFRERGQMIDRDKALHGDRPQIGDEESLALFQAFGELRLEPDTKARCVILQAKEQA